MKSSTSTKDPKYNLSFVLKETDIKADTLRAWERRYQLPTPVRTDGGHRLFSDYDIEIIKWLKAKQKEGMSISRAVDLFRELESKGHSPIQTSISIPNMTHGSSPTGLDHEVLTVVKEAWVNACMNFDETSAEQILNQAFAQFSTEIVCTEILQSGLSDVGTLWYQGKASVQQEHFTSELANRRLHSLISAAPQPIRNKAVLVGCPDGENHTFAALLISLLLRYRGWNVVYLGASVPNGKLQETIDQTKPDLVIMTAMRIVTAAALLDTANFLFENNIPVAFGGGVFNHLPSLVRRIPGYFLGEHILESVDKIENLLLKPNLPVVSPQESFNLSDVKHRFIENKQQIEIIVTEQLKGTLDQDFSLSELNLTLNFLSQDIIAALSLGDLDIIGANLNWAKRLMQHREIPEDQLEGLLSAYLNAVTEILKEQGKPIITLLKDRS